jgi:hypothetical protein
LLVAGCWLLVAGCWLLVAGCRLSFIVVFEIEEEKDNKLVVIHHPYYHDESVEYWDYVMLGIVYTPFGM